MVGLNRTLLSLVVSESDKGKEYWASRPWSDSDTATKIRSANVLVVPWENFRKESAALFPNGTTDFIAALKASDLELVEVAIDKANYLEISLHSDEWRLPTLFCKTIVLPLLLNMLANHIDEWLFSRPGTSIVEQELIVDGGDQKCISIHYKGPPTDLVSTFRNQVAACFPPTGTVSSRSSQNANISLENHGK